MEGLAGRDVAKETIQDGLSFLAYLDDCAEVPELGTRTNNNAIVDSL